MAMSSANMAGTIARFEFAVTGESWHAMR